MPDNRPHILIVDDQDLVLRALVRSLRNDFVISAALNGIQALANIATNEICAAVVDYDLPDIKGTEILRSLRERVPHALRIMISGRDLPAYEQNDQTGLIHHFLYKPFEPRLLRDLLWIHCLE